MDPRLDAWACAGAALVLGGLTVLGCEAEDEDVTLEDEEAAVADRMPATFAAMPEVGEPSHEPRSTQGTACRAACAAAGALGCGAVSAICATTTTITIGGTTIPCAWAMIAACTAEAAGVVVCSEKCPP